GRGNAPCIGPVLPPPNQRLQAGLVTPPRGASWHPVPAARHRRGRGPADPVHLRASAPGSVPHPSHAALALAMAGSGGRTVLPRCGGGKNDPPPVGVLACRPCHGLSRDSWGGRHSRLLTASLVASPR